METTTIKEEITDAQRDVLEIKLNNGQVYYLNKGSYRLVSDPIYATMFPPLSDEHPKRLEIREELINWMDGSFEGVFTFIKYHKAIDDFKKASGKIV